MAVFQEFCEGHLVGGSVFRRGVLYTDRHPEAEEAQCRFQKDDRADVILESTWMSGS